MRRRALRTAFVVAAAAVTAVAGVARPDAADDAVRATLLRDLSSEAAAVRDRASERLITLDGLTLDEVRASLRAAAPRAVPALVQLATTRQMVALVPELAALAAGPDAPAAEAAVRALVAFGEDAVAAGRAALEGARAPGLSTRDRDARITHLAALDVQARVEKDVLARWRRKGGSYRGRYEALRVHGWGAQPVLLAMLLDIPLEDQFVVVPTRSDPELDAALRERAIAELASSRRRGYRSFAPLPPTIEPDELLDLAQQALVDVGDLSVLGPVLDAVHQELVVADMAAGWRPRPFEDAFALDLEVIFAARGDPAKLRRRRSGYEHRVNGLRRRMSLLDPEQAADDFSYFASRLDELAAVSHQLDDFDGAAARYAEAIEVRRRLTGLVSSISSYNRACSLARGGRTEEAIDALEAALDPDTSTGSQDLTQEWVMEDGDLASLHDDPRFRALMKRHFGKPK